MATKHGFPPGFRFVPTDEEVVRLYLVPRIQDQPLVLNDIIEDDPLSAPPWALLEKHGQKREAFFFAACQAMNAKGGRQKRTCVGHGTWEGQGKRKRQEQGQEVKKKLCVRVPSSGEEIEVEWEKYALNFHEHGVKGSTGWVMHEYSVTAPPEFARSPVRAYCIRFSGHGKNAKKRSARDAQHCGSDDEFEDEDEEVDDEAGAIATATSWSAAAEEEDAARLIDEYLTKNPLVSDLAVDVVSANPADGADARGGNDQDLPALVDDDGFSFMNSLPDLLPAFDFSL